eukprot:SAG31_NODE_366_length_16817_cov_17.317921_21_plen_93_part_00
MHSQGMHSMVHCGRELFDTHLAGIPRFKMDHVSPLETPKEGTVNVTVRVVGSLRVWSLQNFKSAAQIFYWSSRYCSWKLGFGQTLENSLTIK